jgi:hypothetical protein
LFIRQTIQRPKAIQGYHSERGYRIRKRKGEKKRRNTHEVSLGYTHNRF